MKQRSAQTIEELTKTITTCGNCNSEVIQNYCANCGNPVKLKRIDGHYIQHEIVHVLHFEKGIFIPLRNC